MVLGRKNFLFVGADEAGENLAGPYSLVATFTYSLRTPPRARHAHALMGHLS